MCNNKTDFSHEAEIISRFIIKAIVTKVTIEPLEPATGKVVDGIIDAYAEHLKYDDIQSEEEQYLYC